MMRPGTPCGGKPRSRRSNGAISDSDRDRQSFLVAQVAQRPLAGAPSTTPSISPALLPMSSAWAVTSSRPGLTFSPRLTVSRTIPEPSRAAMARPRSETEVARSVAAEPAALSAQPEGSR